MKQERSRKRRGKTRPCDVRGKSKRKKKMKKKNRRRKTGHMGENT